MPERSVSTLRTCGDESPIAGRGPGQMGWYEFARRFVAGKTVLDVGCGTALGLDVLAQAAASAEGQDLDPRLAKPNVRICPLHEIPSRSFDVVTSIDDNEHVENVDEYLMQLVRIGRRGLFLTTPNWTASRCQWPYHLREYTPRECFHVLGGFGSISLFKGTPSGSVVYPVKYPRVHFVQNDLRIFPITAFPTRCLNFMLPVQFRIHSSNAAWISLES